MFRNLAYCQIFMQKASVDHRNCFHVKKCYRNLLPSYEEINSYLFSSFQLRYSLKCGNLLTNNNVIKSLSFVFYCVAYKKKYKHFFCFVKSVSTLLHLSCFYVSQSCLARTTHTAHAFDPPLPFPYGAVLYFIDYDIS